MFPIKENKTMKAGFTISSISKEDNNLVASVSLLVSPKLDEDEFPTLKTAAFECMFGVAFPLPMINGLLTDLQFLLETKDIVVNNTKFSEDGYIQIDITLLNIPLEHSGKHILTKVMQTFDKVIFSVKDLKDTYDAIIKELKDLTAKLD